MPKSKNDTTDIYEEYRRRVIGVVEAAAAAGALPAGLDTSRISVEPPRDAAHGDITTNAAMVLAKPAGMKPRELASVLAERLAGLDTVAGVDIAGPGFVNLRLDPSVFHAQLVQVLKAGPAYGDSTLGGGRPVNVEYVSNNPTGPLHVGHGRGAVYGDALAGLLEKAGYAVTREYYINDAGAQVDALARSLHLRYRQALGETIGEIPPGLYPGDYLKPVAAALAERDGRKWLDGGESDWLAPLRQFAVDAMMDLIRGDLAALGVRHTVFSSERELSGRGGVEEVLEFLKERGLIYQGILEPPKGKAPDDWEPRQQTLFRATQFGDDVDRPVQKSDGSWTYFATDMAYHLDKYRRGFRIMIDVWGADHGGYVKRMRAAVKALTGGEGELDVKLCQMVNLTEGGKPVKMSKRAGAFVSLRDVIDKVGKDVVRFIMLTRKNDAHLDFDLTRALEQSRDNPVFYVQYAHARCRSVLRHAAEEFSAAELAPASLAAGNLGRLTEPAEIEVIKAMAQWPRMVENAALAHEPHRIAYYLQDFAARFHALWNMGKDNASLRFITADDRELSLARLALVQGVALVVASGLKVFDVEPVEELR